MENLLAMAESLNADTSLKFEQNPTYTPWVEKSSTELNSFLPRYGFGVGSIAKDTWTLGFA